MSMSFHGGGGIGGSNAFPRPTYPVGFPPHSLSSSASQMYGGMDSRLQKRSSSKKKDFKERLERACERFGTTVEQARMAVKGCRKVTYVVDWGKIDVGSCLRKEKRETMMLPNGYRVVFEASSFVWFAETKFMPSQSQADYFVPMYRVLPIGEDGAPEEPGSGWHDNISAAFRRAVEVHNEMSEKTGAGGGGSVGPHRPNGRLYLGIFYPTMQEQLKLVLKDQPHRIDDHLKEIVFQWIDESTSALAATNTTSSSTTSSLSSGSPTPAVQTTDSMMASYEGDFGDEELDRKLMVSQGGNGATSLTSTRPSSDRRNLSNPTTSGTEQNDVNSFTTNPPQQGYPQYMPQVKSEMDLSLEIDFFDGDFPGTDGAYSTEVKEQPQPQQGQQQHDLPPYSSTSASLPSSASLPHASSVPSASSSTATSAVSAPPTSFESTHSLSTPPSNSKDSRSSSPVMFEMPLNRKRALAEGGQALLKFATMSKETGSSGANRLQNIEETLNTLLKQIKESNISDDDVENSVTENRPTGVGVDEEEGDGEATMRMLQMLKEIKKELVSRSRMKRRRTYTEHSSDGEGDEITAPPQVGKGKIYRTESGMNLMFEPLSQAEDSNLFSADVPTSFFGELGGHNNVFLDLADFNYESESRPPIIVGCHLTHEGLFFTLAPPKQEGTTSTVVGFREEDLATAMTSLRIPAASSIARATIQAADKDQNGYVNMEEFLTFLRQREQELKVMFQTIDTDNDGYISLRDLKHARDHGALEETASDEELKALLEWMDTLENAYEDGKIHFEEFRTGLILLPPSTTINDLLRHFRQLGEKPQANYKTHRVQAWRA